MKQILTTTQKYNTIYLDASTPELEYAAFLKLFRYFDDKEGWDFYGGGTYVPREHKDWYKAARKGDEIAAMKLIKARQDYEYEGFTLERVIDPFTEEIE